MPRPRLLALLFVAGAAISAFTMLRGIDPFDEGVMLQAAHRIADGQVPYADFFWPYGPGHPYLLAGLDGLLGDSLLWWRIVRVLCDAGVALLVFVLARRLAPPRWALVAWLCAACAMAQPVSANPFPVALLLGLGALALATTTTRGERWWLWAGVLIGLAAVWRLDFAAYAGAAVLAAALLAEGVPRRRLLDALRLTGVALATAAVLYLPFAIAGGIGNLYDQLVATAVRERNYWTLPFPWVYDRSFSLWPPGQLLEDAKDLLGFYVPLLLVVGTALAALAAALLVRRRGDGAAAVAVPCAVFATALLLYLLPRPDEFHANPGIAVLAVALAACAAAFPSTGSAARAAAIAGAALLALLTAYGVANRASALLRPPELQPLDLPIADGVRARPSDAAALPRIVAAVHRVTAPGEPIYVTTRRSDLVSFNNPLLYVLADRPSILDRDAGLFARLPEQREIVARLREHRPRAVVRWTDSLSVRREENLRGRSTGVRIVDRYLAATYRTALRRGSYELLVRR